MSFQPLDYEPYDFANRRHIGPSPLEMAEMLAVIGAKDLDTLIKETIPAAIRQKKPLELEQKSPLSENDLLSYMRSIANKNDVFASMIGQGYYGTITPPVIQRNILENPAWYTAYTPYQPEISQGRLEALINFQTMVCDLTGLDIANASLLDEATAAAEAMVMAKKASKSKSNTFFVDENCHSQNIAVIKTRAEPLGLKVKVGAVDDLNPEEVFGAIFQYPGTYGTLRDFSQEITALQENKAIGIMIADPMALLFLKEPAAMGADIAVGSTQRFGVPMGFGGPHAAYIACCDTHKRLLPGRLVGVSVDSHGNQAYRLSLQTREQHIRGEKATSNVCTAQALLAIIAGFYAVFHGAEGLKAIAQEIHRKAVYIASALQKAGFIIEQDYFFDTFTVHVGALQKVIVDAAEKKKINLRLIGKSCLGIALDETTNDQEIEALLSAFWYRFERWRRKWATKYI